MIALCIGTSIFTLPAIAALKPFESEKTQRIEGFIPYFAQIGAAIVKEGESEPHQAADDTDKVTVEVGDTLYVPVGVKQAIRTQYEKALNGVVWNFQDKDGDIPHETGGNFWEEYSSVDPVQAALGPKTTILTENKETLEKMSMTVEWYTMAPGATSFTGAIKVGEGVETVAPDAFGVPYTVKIDDAGRQIGFKITPITLRGLPNLGVTIEVYDISKIFKQEEPTDPGLPLVPGPGGENPDNGKPDVDNPNIGGGGVVQSPFAKYQVVIVKADGTTVVSGSTTEYPYVTQQYTAVIKKIRQDAEGIILDENNAPVSKDGTPAYDDVTGAELTALQNNIVWELAEPGENGDVIIRSGVSANLGGVEDVSTEEIQALETAYAPIAATNISGRLANGTLKFTTQITNADKLAAGSEGSEQGLVIRAILIADDKLEIPADTGTVPAP